MRENGKTVAYIGVALCLGVVTILARPKQETLRAPTIVGKPLFDKFTDATKAASLEVVRYAEDVGEVHTFEVAKNASNGLWSIPSHGNYPADAQNQMKEAASSLVGLTVLGVASEDQRDHELFGVIEPNKEKLKVGDKGVGLLVSFKNEKGENLARLIVGQQVKDATDQRFVRIPGQDPVYVAKITPDKLSTKFEDWIEKDLLKISTWDVERLRLKDYSVLPTANQYLIQPRSEITASFNQTDAKWKLDELITFKGKEMIKSNLLEGEEPNKEKLDAIKTALGDVKIVDVYPKPKGLGATLKASGDFAKDVEARRSLEARGFILNQSNELLSANGELHALTKDGVEYVLRFGNVAGEEEGSKEGKLNRYLFVTARVDESKFPPPQLEELPTDSPATPAAPPSEPGAKPAAPQKTDKPAKPEPAKPATPGAGGEGQATETKAATAPDQQKKPADEPTAKDAGKTGKKSEVGADKKNTAAATAQVPSGADKNDDSQASEEDLKKKKLEADRDRITKENQRKLDEWNEKKKKAEEKVQELNGRFADWYYVISEDVYKKLHLSRSDVIKEGEKAVEEGTGVDTFRKLEKDGLKKKDDTKPDLAPNSINP